MPLPSKPTVYLWLLEASSERRKAAQSEARTKRARTGTLQWPRSVRQYGKHGDHYENKILCASNTRHWAAVCVGRPATRRGRLAGQEGGRQGTGGHRWNMARHVG